MIKRILTFLAVSVVITLAIALGLIASQRPAALQTRGGLDFTGIRSGQAVRSPEKISVKMRDGMMLSAGYAASDKPNAPLLVLIHGSGWHGQQFDRMAAALGDMADVLVPDLRGHGVNPMRRGDIDHMGQFEEDLADLIAAQAKPGQKVIVGGHSSGGGLVVRMAGGDYGELIDEAILMAPFLQYDAPTTRVNSGGWARILMRRIVGLSMLNMAGIHALDGLTVIQFTMPKVVLDGPLGDTATTAYSWRLNQSFSPRRDWHRDVAALPKFTLIAGSEDEAFFAKKYQPVLGAITDKGRYVMVDGVGHLDVVNAPETIDTIRSLLGE